MEIENSTFQNPKKRATRFFPRQQRYTSIIIWQGRSERCDWFFLGRDFTIRTVSTETVQVVYFFVFKSRQILLQLKLLKENM